MPLKWVSRDNDQINHQGPLQQYWGQVYITQQCYSCRQYVPKLFYLSSAVGSLMWLGVIRINNQNWCHQHNNQGLINASWGNMYKINRTSPST